MKFITLIASLMLVNLAEFAVTVLPVKIGETLILDIGREVREWRRVRDGVEETIRPCSKNEKDNSDCSVWTSQNSKNAGDGRESMHKNGTLVIQNVQPSDAGDYFSNDELERIHYTADGQIWKLARTRISVFPIQ